MSCTLFKQIKPIVPPNNHTKTKYTQAHNWIFYKTFCFIFLLVQYKCNMIVMSLFIFVKRLYFFIYSFIYSVFLCIHTFIHSLCCNMSVSQSNSNVILFYFLMMHNIYATQKSKSMYFSKQDRVRE